MFTAIRWFAHNSVAANLLMIMLLVGGGLSLITTNQEEFPMFEIPVVRVGVPYLGAAPVEVEKSVCIRIEEAIEGVEGSIAQAVPRLKVIATSWPKSPRVPIKPWWSEK